MAPTSATCCDGKGKWCAALDRVFTEANRKGINPVILIQVGVKIFDADSGKATLRGVAYKKTERDRGVLINFCPFCGADLKELTSQGVPARG